MTVDIRQPIALRTLHGIELAAVGTWNASTGTTTFTDEDFTNAIAALQCPGVRNPVIPARRGTAGRRRAQEHARRLRRVH
jgi:hypothetical protein